MLERPIKRIVDAIEIFALETKLGCVLVEFTHQLLFFTEIHAARQSLLIHVAFGRRFDDGTLTLIESFAAETPEDVFFELALGHMTIGARGYAR